MLFAEDACSAAADSGRCVLSDAFDAGGPGPWPDELGIAMRRWAEDALAKPIRTLSLFSGAGGLDIGFHDAGFAIKAAVEIDPRFSASLSANAGPNGYLEGLAVNCTDIREFTPEDYGKIDFICGGPPCQSFSAAGRRAAGVAGTQDARGSLFEEYVRLLKQLSPKGFLFENVYGITGAEQGRAWDRITRAFADAGYKIHFRVLDAADYGVPQHRERMIIVGTKGIDYKFPAPTHGPDSPGGVPYYTAEQAVANAALSDAELCATIGGRFGPLLSEIPPGLNYSFFTEKMGHPNPIFAWRSKFSDFLYKADPTTPVRTLKAQGGQYTGPFHWDSRPFGLAELKRLQTFPDAYSVQGGRQVAIHQLGNSVPPQLARVLAASILAQVFHTPLPGDLPYLNPDQQLGFRRRKRSLTGVYQSKARAAIATTHNGIRPELQPGPYRRSFSMMLSADFGCKETQDGEFRVRVRSGAKTWRFDIAPEKRKALTGRPPFTIVLRANASSPWVISTEAVELRCWDKSRQIFTVAWKAFELELGRLGIKADLVQLCEYYQYQPRLAAEMKFGDAKPSRRWKTLAKVVSGCGTRQILRVDQLSSAWEASEEEVGDTVKWLRRIGYEVRNRNTNPQIPEGCFLIPYAFPTLTPMSVQLRKSLEG